MAPEIPLYKLLYLILPLLLCWGIYYRWCGVKGELWIATGRMVAQLLLIGYALNYLFTNDAWWMGLVVVCVMSLAASLIAVRPFKEQARAVFGLTFMAVMLSGALLLALIYYCVLTPDQIYAPRTFIPIAGMIFSSSMNTVSLCGERYFNERQAGHSHLVARATAYNAAMIPKVNSFLAVGIVSLPGMMTGQILAGIPPLVAVRYQIMVMLMLLRAGGIAAGLFLYGLQRMRERP